MTGALFQEINYLRNAITVSEQQRLEYKTQNAMLRGEIELAKCQTALFRCQTPQGLQKNNQRRRSVDAIKNKININKKKNLLPTDNINYKLLKNNTLQRSASMFNSVLDITKFFFLLNKFY